MNTRRLTILAGLVLISLSASGCGYNTLTTKQQDVKGKWANVETQLQRRGDLFNNLVESAKMAGIQEQEVFGKIAEARSRLINATNQAPQARFLIIWWLWVSEKFSQPASRVKTAKGMSYSTR